jgi:hypothetical protein
MVMTRNMGVLDRIARVFVVAPVLIGIGVVVGPASAASWILYGFAGVMVLTSAIGFCPTYRLLGINTVGAGSRLCDGCRVPLAR